ncbi:MAG: hypothetical protein Q8Q06_03885 [bacterium]|nr:hypothetical protein [bacterium]
MVSIKVALFILSALLIASCSQAVKVTQDIKENYEGITRTKFEDIQEAFYVYEKANKEYEETEQNQLHMEKVGVISDDNELELFLTTKTRTETRWRTAMLARSSLKKLLPLNIRVEVRSAGGNKIRLKKTGKEGWADFSELLIEKVESQQASR